MTIARTSIHAQRSSRQFWRGRFPATRFARLAYLCSILFCVLLSAFGGIEIAGYSLRGYAWVFQAVCVVIVVVFVRIGPHTYPVLIWLPWLAWLVVRCPIERMAIQRTIMLGLCPLYALAASMLCSCEADVKFVIRSFSIVIVLLGVAIVGNMLYSIPFIDEQQPAFVMTLCLIAAYYAVLLYEGQRWALLPWIACVILCTVTGMRTALACTIITILLYPRRVGMRYRIVGLFVCCVVGIYAFQFPAVRAKLTRSQDVSVLGIIRGEEALLTSGRTHAWSLYMEQAHRRPWLGNGGNASAIFGMYNIQGLEKWHHPHNEYIRIYFDYGILGVIFFWGALAYSVYDLLKLRTHVGSPFVDQAITFVISGLLLIPLLSITGNVLVYVAFYGIILFSVMGMVYALAHRTSAQGPSSSSWNRHMIGRHRRVVPRRDRYFYQFGR